MSIRWRLAANFFGRYFAESASMLIELSHYSEEYSSANDPILALKLFQATTLVSSAFAFAIRRFCFRATNSQRNDSTTPDKLSVMLLA